jgi:hypothetical protein
MSSPQDRTTELRHLGEVEHRGPGIEEKLSQHQVPLIRGDVERGPALRKDQWRS